MKIKLSPITERGMCGFQAKRSDGLTVELVRCYANCWAVWLTLAGNVVALPTHRSFGNSEYLPYQKARQVALALL